ncbi:MAG: MmcQ/YjbR family DNA-binding protein [Pseudomonadota bacterium]
MTRDGFNAYCRSLPATTHVVQWGNSDVWKVGGKLFTVCGWNGDAPAFTFKVSELMWEVLRDAPGFRPAPYLASRGMLWIQAHDTPAVDADEDLKGHIRASYDLIVAKLTRKLRAELNL